MDLIIKQLELLPAFSHATQDAIKELLRCRNCKGFAVSCTPAEDLDPACYNMRCGNPSTAEGKSCHTWFMCTICFCQVNRRSPGEHFKRRKHLKRAGIDISSIASAKQAQSSEPSTEREPDSDSNHHNDQDNIYGSVLDESSGLGLDMDSDNSHVHPEAAHASIAAVTNDTSLAVSTEGAFSVGFNNTQANLGSFGSEVSLSTGRK